MTASEIALEQFLDETRDARLERYLDFLRIPSISTLPDHADDCRIAAEWLAGQLSTIGVEHVDVEDTGGHPIVTGDWLTLPRAPPPRSSTATTTSSRSIRSTSGNRHHSPRSSRATGSRLAARPTTRARS